MRMWRYGTWLTLGAFLALSAPLNAQAADENLPGQRRPGRNHAAAIDADARAIQAGAQAYARRRAPAAPRYAQAGGFLQCVPFARENSGIELIGDAHTWWKSATGVYERGARPEVGSVMSFRANGRMPLGHVAVVSKVINSRNVEIDQANWASRGRVSRNIDVVDVSPDNDWTAVRVAVGDSDVFGSIYPTYGFIYDRPDRGQMVANTGTASLPALNPAPRDLRPARERILVSLGADQDEEVAETPDAARPRVRAASAVRAQARSVRTYRSSIARNAGAPVQPVPRTAPNQRVRNYF